MDFRTQMMRDLDAFYNPAEFAEPIEIRYGGVPYHVNAVLSETQADDAGIPAPGLGRVAMRAHLSQKELGFVPERGDEVEITQCGASRWYRIAESVLQDGGIALGLEALDE